MVTNLKNAIDIGLTCEETEILAQADEILFNLQNYFGERLNLTSIDSGEVISINELARARGILGGLASYRGWIVSINERVE